MIERYRVIIRGTRPLLQHRFVVAGGRRSTTWPTPDAEAESGLYRNEAGVIYEPSSHIEGSLTKAAGEFKVPGKARKSYREFVTSGLLVEPEQIPHKNQTWVTDARLVVVPATRGRVMRGRPRLNEWGLEFSLVNLDPANLTQPQIREILEAAGQFKGIGDYRPKFGLFEVLSFEKET